MVDIALKCCRDVGQANGDNCVLVAPIIGLKGCLLFVTLLYTHKMVHIADVKFCKILGT
jgi:hypothetical protein